jgi:hypothetical protein
MNNDIFQSIIEHYFQILKTTLMNYFLKMLNPLFGLGLLVALFSCGSSTEPAKDDTKKADSPAVAATPPPPPPFQPFDVVEIRHRVKSYAKWRPSFDADSVNRKPVGLETIDVNRNDADSNDILIVMKASDLDKAKAFSTSPKLKEAMQKGGVVSKPVVETFHIIRLNMNSHEKEAVVINHKVKDFATWLKAFDGEGADSRANQGLIDLALGRGIADSNLVQIVFDIKDTAKARASIFSEDKKKLMTSAGVIGKPSITFYHEP